MTKLVRLIDQKRCMGCRSCIAACAVENHFTPDAPWNTMIEYEVGTFPKVKKIYISADGATPESYAIYRRGGDWKVVMDNIKMLVAKRRIQLDRPVEQWVDIALALPGIQLAPLEPAIAVRSAKLPGEFHPDPADRIIVATALENAVPIITPDERIRSYPHVQSAW